MAVLAAGCLFQTVRNVLDGRDPTHGINDHDLIYHDASDLSWDAEDVVDPPPRPGVGRHS